MAELGWYEAMKYEEECWPLIALIFMLPTMLLFFKTGSPFHCLH